MRDKIMRILLTALALLVLAVPLSAQTRTSYIVHLDSLPAEQARELAAVRERAGELSMEMDPMVAYLARDILTALIAAPPNRIDLRSWSITPIGFDRVIINGSLFMARSGAPGSMRSYTFTITPEAGGS